MNGLITALRTLTILPVKGRDADDFASSLPYFPLVGGLIGSLAAFIVWLVIRYSGWHEAAAVSAVAVSFIITGGLHLDGFADVCDSLGGRTPERRLEIMKDTHKGSFGVAGVVVLCLAKYVCILKLISLGGLVWLIVAAVCARLVQVVVSIDLPYARKNGGTARRFVQGAKVWHFLVASALTLLMTSGLCRLAGFAAMAVALVAGLLLAFWAKRMFGGVTGDVIGMSSETVEIVVMVFGVLSCGS